MITFGPQGTVKKKKTFNQSGSTECILRLFVAVLLNDTLLPTVLKRATTIKRRGMDAGQSGEEYSDISSVGE